MRAYVLITCTTDSAAAITGILRGKPEIICTDRVNGPYPVIAVIESDSPSIMVGTILYDIRNMPGVEDVTVFLSEHEPEIPPAEEAERPDHRKQSHQTTL